MKSSANKKYEGIVAQAVALLIAVNEVCLNEGIARTLKAETTILYRVATEMGCHDGPAIDYAVKILQGECSYWSY